MELLKAPQIKRRNITLPFIKKATNQQLISRHLALQEKSLQAIQTSCMQQFCTQFKHLDLESYLSIKLVISAYIFIEFI